LSVLVAIGGLAFLILIHEAGHFFVALAVRMRPRRFYIFFPPPLVKRVRNGIEYGIGTIPLGGYVKIPGMHKPAARDLEGQLGRALDEAPWLERHVEAVKASLDAGSLADARAALPELRAAIERAELSAPARRAAERAVTDLDDGLSDDAYWRAPVWKRVVVILAGPGTNLVFALVLLAIVFMIGIPVASHTVAEVRPGSPAVQAGLRPGDRVLTVNGEDGSPRELADSIATSGGKPLTVRIRRGGEVVTLHAHAKLNADGDYRLGFAFGARQESYGFAGSVRRAFVATWDVTKGIGESLARIVTGSGRKDVSSVVGITAVSSEAVQQGLVDFLFVLAFISLSLALLNLLPLLPLDGGHIAFSLAEAIRGRAIPREAYERASAIGIVLVLFLFFIGLTNDVDRLRGG
jgi:regulator of sigma E protease